MRGSGSVYLSLLVSACASGAPRDVAVVEIARAPAAASPDGGTNGSTCTAGGCISGTDVADTPENRAVIAFCERYRTAVERRDVETLLSLASHRYLDTGGTPDPSDDVDYAELRRYILDQIAGIDAIRYEIRYRKITRKGQRIRVTYTYSAAFQQNGVWKRLLEDNVMELERNGSTFEIVSGM